MHWYPGMMPRWGAFGGLIMIIFWIVIAVVAVLLIKWFISQSIGRGESKENRYTPMEILKRRYARGEIDKAEYEEKKKDLEG